MPIGIEYGDGLAFNNNRISRAWRQWIVVGGRNFEHRLALVTRHSDL